MCAFSFYLTLSLSLCLSVVLTHWHKVVKPALTSTLAFRSWFQTRRLWRRAVKVQRQAVCSPAPLTRGQSNVFTRADHPKPSTESHQSWNVPHKGTCFVLFCFWLVCPFSCRDYVFHLKGFDKVTVSNLFTSFWENICLFNSSSLPFPKLKCKHSSTV